MLIALLACTDPALRLEGDPEVGAEIYEAECTLCHGAIGEGTSRGPEITMLYARLARSLALEVIRDGRGEMPAYVLSDPELADLLAHLAEL